LALNESTCSASDAGPVTTGDWIGLVRGEGIVAVAGSVTAAAISLLEHLVTDDHEIVTVIVGADATRERTSEVLAWLAEQRPHCEVEVHGGGQPLYPYLFGVE
jgi:dihydroxyacetone kinase-like predicted kinase